ncbi:MAG: serine/threonine-protein kinase [Planctomycetota bacterium]|nr:serine/threonine-protein kinase [Planctomycetota bacterium]
MSRRRYEVGQEITPGYRVFSMFHGFLGVVYIGCKEQHPDEPRKFIAVKTFRHGDQLSRGLFDAELENWVRLPGHPNVVRALGADRKRNLLILEFVPGPSLQKIAHRRPVHPRHFLRWAGATAAGLRFLHEENHFVHRDLRPANILVDTDDGLCAKISDMGIGKPLDPEARQHTVIGTFTYMAPEVFDGRTDYRSDIFSFGATIYYLLTGMDAIKLTTQHMTRVATPEIPGVPRAVSSLVLRCLERQPEARFPSMNDVVEAIAAIDDWRPPSDWYRHCEEHDYDYRVESRDDVCPFCAHHREFEKRLALFQRACRDTEK